MTQESSAARVAGKVFRTFEMPNGEQYLLSQPLTVGSYADEEAIIKWKQRDPMEFALRMMRQLPASYHAAINEGCANADKQGIPTQAEWDAYNASSYKIAYMFWHCLDPKHKRDSQGEFRNLIDGVQWALDLIAYLPPDKLAELKIKIALVSQDTAIKNSSGRPAPAESAPDQPKDTPSTAE